MLRKKIVIGVVGLAALAVFASLLSYLHWVEARRRWTTVVDGEFYQSAKMPPSELVERAMQHGLRAVIDLRDDEPDNVAAERRALTEKGIKYKHLPTQYPPSDDTVRDFVDFLSKLEHRPALVHCSEGEGRSVLFAALYRIHFEGWSNEQALDGTTRLPAELKFLGALFPGFADFDPVTVKGQYVLKYERVTPEKPGRPKKENKGQ
ncbi:MAG: sulfur transferase domain-containing protein [Planctomycetota bacterium]|nr:sulfur transferase domain-containing protein [Planctomycetota bacterium]